MDTNHHQYITVSSPRQHHSSFLNYDQRSSSLSPLLPTLRRMSTNEYHDPLRINENRMDLSPLKTIKNHHQHHSIPPSSSSSPSLLKTITTSTSSSSPSMKELDFILQQQANILGISAEEQKQRFEKQRNQFQQYMIQLQNLVNHDHVTFDEIKSFLHTILVLAEEMMGSQTVLFMDIFPEWKLWEGFVQKLVTYIQCIDDMKQLITQKLQSSNDLAQDIKAIYQLLDTRKKLYGDTLIQNGLEWKAMGLPVDMELLHTVKLWFLYISSSLLDELDIACPSNNTKDQELYMENVLVGLEVVASIIAFIGLSNKKVYMNSQILVTIYGQWISETLEQINELQIKHHTLVSSSTKNLTQHQSSSNNYTNNSNGNKMGRMDLRLMELLEYMGRILDALQIIQDNDRHIHGFNNNNNDINNNNEMMDDSIKEVEDIGLLETITDMLVEINVRAIAVIETQRCLGEKGKGITNVMSLSYQSSFIYMEESLLTFAEKIVELAGREWIDRPKLQRLHAYLEKMEIELTEDS
ncbi:unnamed protein product [Cunninghamella echinulata]